MPVRWQHASDQALVMEITGRLMQLFFFAHLRTSRCDDITWTALHDQPRLGVKLF
jgi:hypothetical protein